MLATDTPRDILLATWEGGGTVGPALTVARKLVARGHRVRVMSDRCNRPEAEAAGAVFIPWTRAPSRPDRSRDTDVVRDWAAASPVEGLIGAIQAIFAGPALAYARDLLDELGRAPADLVVSSEMLFGVHAACEAAGQPLVLLTANISLFPLPGVPPMGPGLKPASTPAEQALHAEIAAGSRQMFDSGLPALNAARAELGLAPLASVYDQVAVARRILLGTSRAFDFAPASLPPALRYIGPQLDTPGWAAPWRSPWPEEDRRPLVLVGFSTSFQDQAAALQSVIAAMHDLPVRALVTLGDAIAPADLRAPPHVQLVHSAPHDAVLRQAALVVTHGGHGTVLRALMHGRPLLVMPQGRDQADNAVRVTERGAGLMLPADATPATIRAALLRLLEEPGFAWNAVALGEDVARDVAQSPVVQELESLASRCIAAPCASAA